MHQVLGIFSALIFFIGESYYIRDILLGKTKPHRVTFLVFLILDLIYLGNQYALGASSTLWLVAAWTLAIFVIFLLSIKRGVGGLSKLDISCMIGVTFGLFLWWVLKSPLASVYCNIVVSLFGYVPTLKKSYLHPQTETKIAWLLGSLSAGISAASVGKLDYKILLLPIYSFAITLVVFLLLAIRSKQLQSVTNH